MNTLPSYVNFVNLDLTTSNQCNVNNVSIYTTDRQHSAGNYQHCTALHWPSINVHNIHTSLAFFIFSSVPSNGRGTLPLGCHGSVKRHVIACWANALRIGKVQTSATHGYHGKTPEGIATKLGARNYVGDSHWTQSQWTVVTWAYCRLNKHRSPSALSSNLSTDSNNSNRWCDISSYTACHVTTVQLYTTVWWHTTRVNPYY